MVASSIKCQFHDRKLSNQQNREGRSLRSRPSFRIVREENRMFMRNPSHSVVHLIIRKDKIKLAVGTGVLYLKDNQSYIITAWHNISGRNTETLKLLSKKVAIPNNFIASIDVQIKQADFVGFIRISIRIPLIENNKTTYFIHPQGYPKVDVVAIPVDLQKEYIMEGSLASGANIDMPMRLKSNQSNSLEKNIIHIQDCEFKS